MVNSVIVSRTHGARSARKTVLREALFASTALVGVSLAQPAAAQTINPAGGGTVTTTNGTITGGSANEGVQIQQTGAGGVTAAGVSIINTGTTPNADGLRVIGAGGGRGVGLGVAQTSTITSQSGDGVRLQGGNGENVGFGVTAGQTLNVTGVNGLHITSMQGLFLPDVGNAGAINATARTNGSGTGILVTTSSGFGGSWGTVTSNGFATGIGLSGNGVGSVIEGGTINATTTGVDIASTANVILNSNAAITAPTGINIGHSTGAVVTTGTGGTIDSNAVGTGAGIVVSGGGDSAITVGAAIGGTTRFATGVRATFSGAGTNSVTNNSAITATTAIAVDGAAAATINLNAGSTTTGNITSTGSGARTANVASMLAGNYTATGTGASTVNLSAGSIGGNVVMGTTAGTFNWTGGTLAGSLAGGNGFSTLLFDVGAGQVRTLSNISSMFGQVRSGALVLNGQSGSNGSWRILDGALLRIGGTIALPGGGTFASLQDSGGSLQVDTGASLSSGGNINAGAGTAAKPVTVTVLGTLANTGTGFNNAAFAYGAITNNGGGYLNIVNGGTVTAGNNPFMAAIGHNGGTTNVTNTGTILGGAAGSTQSAYGIWSLGGTLTVVNSGAASLIRGAAAGILQQAGMLNLTNDGTVSGTEYGISSTGGTTTLSGTGAITGGIAAIRLSGANATTLRLNQGSALTGQVLAQDAGARTLVVNGALNGDYAGATGTGLVNFTLGSTGAMQGATFGSAGGTFNWQGGAIGGVVDGGSGSSYFNAQLGAGNSASIAANGTTNFLQRDLQSGTLTLTGSSTGNGFGWQVQNGATLNFATTAFNVAGGASYSVTANGGSTVNVLQGASISGANNFARAAGSSSTTVTYINAGTINLASGGGDVFRSSAPRLDVTNSGTMTSTYGGVIFAAGGGVLTNTGTITGGSFTTSNIGTAVQMAGTSTVNNNGTGIIQSSTGGPYTILNAGTGTINNQAGAIIRQVAAGQAAAIYSSSGALTINNDGIISTAATGASDAVTSLSRLTLTNTGTITAPVASGVAFTAASSSIANSGTIAGGNDATYGYGVQAAGASSGSITNQSGGTITGTTGGILRATSGAVTISNSGIVRGTGATSYGVNATGGSGTITNAANAVIAGQTAGITSAGTINLTNSGTIGTGTVDSAGAFTVGGAGFAVQIAGGTINNSGILNSTGASIYQTSTTGTLNLVNSGTIGGAGRAVDPDDTILTRGTATILNSGTITTPNYYAVAMALGGTLTNAAGGLISAGTADDNRYAVTVNGASGTINNYGTLTSTSATRRAILTDNNAATINLYAGSTTGAIQTGAGADTLALYTGRGTGELATVDAATGITLQNAGTLGATNLNGAINLGGGANVVLLRGTGNGSATTGVGGIFSLTGDVGLGTLTKRDLGTWTLTGNAAGAGLAQINAGIGGTPGSGGLLVFDGTTNLTSAINVNGGTIRALNSGAFGTGTITMTDPTAQYASGTYSNPIVLASTDTTNDPATLQTFGTGAVARLTGAISQTGTPAQRLVFSSVDANNLASTGTFELTNGANDYLGVTTISAGTTVIERDTGTALGRGIITVDQGGVLRFDRATFGTIFTEAGTIAGGGTLRFTGSGNNGTAIGGVNGALTIAMASGALIDVVSGVVNGSTSEQGFYTGNLADLSIAAGAAFDGVEGAVRVDALTGAGTLRGGYQGRGSTTIGVDNGNGSFSGALADSNTASNGRLILTKIGTGTQTLSGSLNYTGGTTVSGGTLKIVNGTLPAGPIQIGAAGRLEYNVTAANTNFGQSNGTTLTGTGVFAITGNTPTSSISWRGAMRMGAGGQLRVESGRFVGSSDNEANWTNNAGDLFVASDATFVTSEAKARFDKLTGAGSVQIDGTGSLTLGVAGGTAQFDGVIQNQVAAGTATTGTLVKTGAGMQTLTGINTYTGGTTISAGTLALSGAGSILNSAAVTNNGSFSIAGRTGATSVNQLTGTGTVALGANTLTTNNAAAGTISGVIAGSGGFTKAGAGNLTLSAANTYTGGTTVSGGTLTTTTAGIGTGAANVASGTTLAFNQATAGGYAGAIGGSGALSVTGTGPVTLNGAITTGTFTLAGTGSQLVLGGARTGASGNGLSIIGAGSRVTVTNTGSVMGSTAGSAIFYNGTGTATVSNAGSIVSQGADAVLSSGTAIVDNIGTISATGTNGAAAVTGLRGLTLTNTGVRTNGTLTGGIITAVSGEGAYWTGGAGTVNNSGQITGGDARLNFGYGVRADTGATGTVTNLAGGVIEAAQAGILAGGTSLTINNSSLVRGTAGYGVSVAAGTGTVTNASGGTIAGSEGSFLLTSGNAVTLDLQSGSTTAGQIQSSGAGARTITVGGSLDGAYNGGTGTGTVNWTLGRMGNMQAAAFGNANDSFLFQGGSIGGTVDAGAGDDGFNSDLGAGNSATLNLSNLVNFESFTSQSGNLTVTGTSSNAVSIAAGNFIVDGTLNAPVAPASGAILTVTRDGTISSPSGVAVQGPGAGSYTVVNAGTITTANGDGSNAINGGATLNLTNSGTIQSGQFVAVASGGDFSVVTNAYDGRLLGGTDSTNGTGVALAGANALVNNYGLISGAGTIAGGLGTLNTGVGGTVNLFAGSTTGAIVMGEVSTLALYNGTGTDSAGLVADGVLLQQAGINAAAVFGPVSLGENSTLQLRGTGDGSETGGAAGTYDLATAANLANLLKLDTGTWVLTGASASPGATIFAGNGGANTDGTLIFRDTVGLTNGIIVNGAIIRAESDGAFGTGTITMVDPTMQYGVSGTTANAILLASNDPANDPSRIQLDGGVTQTFTGAITEQNGPQPLVFELTGANTQGPVPLRALAASAATAILTNENNLWTGTTTIGTGLTLQGTTQTISGGTIFNDGTLAYVQATDGTVQQRISGSGTLVKDGAGVVTINQGNTYSGGTSVLAGTLVSQDTGNGFGYGDVAIASGATAQFLNTRDFDGDDANAVFVAGGTYTGTGTLLLANTANGRTAFGNNGGTVDIALGQGGLIDVQGGGYFEASTNNQGSWTNNQGSLNVGEGTTFRTGEAAVLVDALTGAGTIELANAGQKAFTLGVANGTGTFAGVMTGDLGLTKEGTGTQTLTGANTFTGDTTINAGTLALAGNGSIANSTILIGRGTADAFGGTLDISGVANGGTTVQYLVSNTNNGGAANNSAILLGANTLTLGADRGGNYFDGVISGTGGLTLGNNATLYLAGANTFTGTTLVTNGATLFFAANDILADTSTLTVDGGGTVDLQGFSDKVGTFNLSGTLRGGGTLTADNYNIFAGSRIEQGIGGGALNIYGDTVLTSQTNAAPVSIYAGTLTLGDPDQIGNPDANPSDFANRLSPTGAVRIAGGAGLTLGGAETIGSLGDLNGGGGTVDLAGSLLTVGGDNSSTTFSGVIGNTGPRTRQYNYVGSFSVGDGPDAATNPMVYSGRTAAALLFGGDAGSYSLSTNGTDPTTVNRRAYLDGRYRDENGVETADRSFLDNTGSEDEAYTNGTGYSDGDFGYSAYVRDHTAPGEFVNYVFNSVATPDANGLTKTGTGTLTLTGANTFTGLTTIDGGTLALGGGQAIADGNTVLVNANGTLALLAGERIGSLAGTGAVALAANTLTLGTDGQSSSFAGVISGAGGVTQTGAGTLTLSGANTYTGTTLVDGSTLVFGASDVLANGSTLVVSNGTANLGANNDTIAALALTNAVLAGTGMLTANSYALNAATVNANLGAGTLNQVGGISTLNGTAGAGTVNVNAGTLRLGGNDRLAAGAAVTVAGGAVLDTAGFTQGFSGAVANAGTVAGAGVTLAGGRLTNAGTVSAPLTTTGTAGITNTGSIAGGILPVSGTLVLDNAGAVSGGVAGAAGLTLYNRTGGAIAGADDAIRTGGVVGVNAGTIAGGTGAGLAGTDTVTFANANGALVTGGTDAVLLTGAAASTIDNYGTLQGGNGSAVAATGTAATTVTLRAGSTTGRVTLAGGNDTLTLYTGVTGAAAVTEPNTGATLRAAGDYAAASVGAIDLGGGTNTLDLRGTQTGTLASGVRGITVLNKRDAGSWTATDVGATTVNALGTGTLTLAGTGTIRDIFVNGAELTLASTTAAGGATIHMIDPTTNFAAIGTYANNFDLAVAQGRQAADPNIFANRSNGAITLSGAITESVVGQYVTFTGAGTTTLTGANRWTGVTRVDAGTTLAGTTESISGGSIVDNGVLAYTANADATVAQGITGTGFVTVAGAPAATLTFAGTNAFTGAANTQTAITSFGPGLAFTGATSSVAGTVYLAGANARLDVASGGSLASSGGNTVFANLGNATVTNAGSIRATSASGASVFLNAGGTVANRGTIAAANGIAVYEAGATGTTTLTNATGGTITSGFRAVDLAGAGTVTNAGTISGGTSTGLLLRGGGTVDNTTSGVVTGGSNGVTFINAGTVANAGRIAGTFAGISQNANATLTVTNAAGGTIDGTQNNAVYTGTGAGTVTNAGTLTGGNAAVYADGTLALANTGLIRNTTGGNAQAISGVYSSAAGTQITNAGTIDSQVAGGHAIKLDGGTGSIVNLAGGTLLGNGAASLLLAGAGYTLDFRSGSTVTGLVDAGGTTGANTVTVAGALTGGYRGGTGADGVTLVDTGAFTGTLDGGAGVDALTLSGSGIGTADIGRLVNFESVTKTGTGRFTLTGTDASTASYSIQQGILSVSGGAAINDGALVAIATPGTLDLASTETIGALSGTGAVTLGANTLVVAGDRSTTFAGVISGTGNLVRSGAGTLTLSGGNTYTGATLVTGGTLALGASNVLVDASTISVSSGAILDLGAFSDTVADVALTGTLNGTGTLTANRYQLFGATVNGNLGAGMLFQLGGASVLSGTSNASATMVNAGTLRLGARERLADTTTLSVATGATLDLAGFEETVGSLSGTGALALGAGTLTAGGANADFTFAGTSSGTGGITKTGTGTFTLLGNQGLTGRLTVNAGTLLLAGNTAGSARVQGGTLSGAGTIAGNLALASGTLSPGIVGQPVATIQAGSLAVTGGTYVADFGGTSNGSASDLVRVTGAATLSGGTVAPRAIDATNGYRVMQTYTVLQAGTLTGQFANTAGFTAVGNNADLQYRLRYDLVPNSVLLEVRKQIDFTANMGATTGNQQAVAAAFNGGAFTASDSFAATLNQIAALGAAGRRAAFDSIGGEALASVTSSVALASNRFSDIVRARVSRGGDAANGGVNVGGLFDAGTRGVALRAAAVTTGGLHLSGADNSGGERIAFWAQGFGADGRIEGRNGQRTLDNDTAGLALGFEGRFGNLTLGLAGTITDIDAKVRSLASSNSGTLYQGGGYAAYDDGATFLHASGSYFGGTIDTARSVQVGTAFIGRARGEADTDGYTIGAAVGHRFGGETGIRFTPQIGGQMVDVTRDAFTETGAGNLSLAAGREKRTLYTATAEGRLSHRSATSGGIVEPYVTGGVQVNFGDRDTQAGLRLTGAPTGTGAYTIEGARLGKVVGLLGGGIDAHPTERVTLGAGVETSLSDHQKEARATMRLRIGF